MTRQIHVGGIPIGGGAPVVIQSMLNTKTTDVGGALEQLKQLKSAGCQIARLAVPDMAGLINRIAERMDNKVTAKKLTMVSSNVTPICLMISKSLHISINNITIALGLLKKKLSIQPSVELISHKAIKKKRRRKRENIMIKD